ncbi:AraC family transcriptional regulator [Sphingomonas sp. So64.6b]|uniref:helix-turn-helix domain-containing protein n=1 Tax=Sphingomonas sp. So64.6b TaxID=2997354 RepID=UPI001603D7E5|nr:helix-turn-helix domain-containing protein [Sphingomonas sp. So64.6b]QNA84893.1 AraC family transcriptional regulator [Sphingomonas sp. So64.6b]
MPDARLIRLDAHDDGVNAWSMAHIAPPAALAGLIHGYCDYTERTGGFTARRELPHGDGVLIVNLGDPITIVGGDGQILELGRGEAFVAGIHLHPALSRSNGAQRGVHVFLPLTTLRRLLGVPMHQLLDRVVPLDAILGVAARQLGADLVEARSREERVALLDAALIARIAQTRPLAAIDHHALTLVSQRADLDLRTVADRVGWSRKHLADRIRDNVGIGPRSFRRVLRFHRVTSAVSAAPDPDWAGLAHDIGYCDQSHLVREFREFAGITPSIFVARLAGAGGGLIEH